MSKDKYILSAKTGPHAKGDWIDLFSVVAAGPWRKWPEEKPEKEGRYLVLLQEGDDISGPEVDDWTGRHWDYYLSKSIAYWAEINPPIEGVRDA